MATAQLADVLMDRLPLVGSAVVVLAFTLIVQYLLKRDPLAAFPFAGEDLSSEQKRREAYLINPKSVYMEAYRNFRDNIFKITTATHKNVVVVPIKFLDELKRLPDDVVSFDAAIEDLMVTDYTNLISGDQTITHVVKANLTPALVRLNPILTEEVARAVRSEMPACPDWTDVNVYQKILRIVAIVSGRVFVGPELCHDEGYLDAAINYTVELFNARTAVTRIKPWLRPFRAPFLLEVPSYPQSRDPEPYPEPETWDGLRFHRMREAGEDFNAKSAGRQGSAVDANAHNQFVSVSHRSLVFGYGRHACPGRFFAANEIKMIVARCLLQYDIKLPDGVTQRFPNFEFSGAIVPDPTKTLLFRETR
ncbi:hypothetical protein RB594_002433 [Gaeumannomyces avenae]